MCPPTQCCCCPLYKGVRIWTWIFIVLWLFSAFAYISVGVWLQRLEDECAGTRVRYAMAGLEQNLSLPHTADENGSAVMTDGLWRDAAVVRQMRKETLLVLVWRLLTHVCSASKDSWDVPNAAVCEYEGPEQYQNSIGGRSVYRRASSSVWRRQRWNACSAEFGQSAALASIGSSAENELVRRACGQYICYIGLRKAPGSDAFKWQDSTALGYTNWAPGEPNSQAATDGHHAFMNGPESHQILVRHQREHNIEIDCSFYWTIVDNNPHRDPSEILEPAKSMCFGMLMISIAHCFVHTFGMLSLNQSNPRKIHIFWRAVMSCFFFQWLCQGWYMVVSGDSTQFGQIVISVALGGWWVNAIKSVAVQMSLGVMAPDGQTSTQRPANVSSHGAVIVQPELSLAPVSAPVVRGIVIGEPTLPYPQEQEPPIPAASAAGDVSILSLDPSPRTDANPAASQTKEWGSLAP